MSTYLKIGSMGLLVAGLLNVFRIFPILFTEGVTMDQIPPQTLVDTILISQTNAYLLSHIMAILAGPLAIIGFYNLWNQVKTGGNSIAKQIGLLAFIGLTLGQLLYVLGLIIDGFSLPILTHEYITTNADENSALAHTITAIHHVAMSFAGVGFFSLLISTAIMGVAFLKRRIHQKLAITGLLIGLLAFFGYSFGLLDILIGKSFELTYGLLTLMYVYYFSMGFVGLKTLKQDIK